MICKEQKFEFVESRWREYRKFPPRKGEIFVGRCNEKVYNVLFLKTEGDIVYLRDNGIHIGHPFDFFTHWLHVGEICE